MDPVVVVGGGIIGASVAAHLSEAGLPVVLCERDTLGGGTTAASAAMFIWHQPVPDRTAHDLRERSWATYGRLVGDDTIEFSPIGGLYVAEDADGMADHRATAAELDSLGVETRLLATEDLERYGFAPEAVAGGLLLPEEGYLDPAGIVQHFVGEARTAGARVETGTPVTDVVVEAGRAVGVETDDGRVAASAVVNAAGPWAPALDGMAGVSHPLRHNRGPILVLDEGTDPPLPFVEFEDGHYLRGEGTRQVFAGRYGAPYDDAERLDPAAARGVDADFPLAVADRFDRYLPELADAGVATDWVGLRTVTPDARPLVGATDRPGYYVATGMSGLGVTLAPAVGDHLAAVVADDRTPDPDLREFLSPARFG